MRCNMLKFFAFLFIVFMGAKGITVEAETIDRWDLTKEYTLEEGGVKYHAYLTKDGKESWIYKAELLDRQKVLDVVFPKTMQGVPVTYLGDQREVMFEFHREETYLWDCYYTIFGDVIEPWHTEESPLPEVVNVRSLVLPDTVRQIGGGAFACMANMRYVHLPKELAALPDYIFYGCYDLQKIDFPRQVKVDDLHTFEYCDSLAGLAQETRNLIGDILTYSDNMVINKTEKTLIQVMPQAKKITIPANVEWIEPTAFTNTSLTKIKVAKKNKDFAVAKRCLYDKRDKSLLLIFGKGSTVMLSKKIKRIGEDVMVGKYKIKKLILPKKIKRYDKWKKPYIRNNKKIKIYYRGKRIR